MRQPVVYDDANNSNDLLSNIFLEDISYILQIFGKSNVALMSLAKLISREFND